MNVLLTKRLAQDQLDLIQSWGWRYEIAETLKITQIDVDAVPVKAEIWVVSSRNSFEAIRKFMFEAPERIYCVGGWTKSEIEKLTTKVSVKSFANMKLLADDLSKENIKNVIYFCGREHRNEFEEGLKNTTTKITKVITYDSEMIFPVINGSFDAVFIFSPRSAESLLKHNSFSIQTVFACIGSTTATYLHHRGITNTFVSSYPETKKLLEEFHQRSLARN